MKTISNSDDTIDSRDVEKRITELEDARFDWQEENELPDWEEDTSEKRKNWTDSQVEKWAEWEDSDDGGELKALVALRDELEGYAPDWRHGATLIRRSYFVDYCKELVNDIGDLPKGLPGYIENNINWDGVAYDLEADYTTGDYDGVEYLVRS